MSSKMFEIFFAPFLLFFCVSLPTLTAQLHLCGTKYHSALTYPTSNLTSPYYPNNYPSSTTCEWVITASSGYRVELSFVTFDTQGSYISGACSTIGSDILEIYDHEIRSYRSKLLGKYCNNHLPANVYSSGTSLYLRFKSDSFTQKKGFKIEYKAVIPKPDSTICSPFNTFDQNNNIQLSGSSGYIESPLYGTKYPSNMQCTWVITVADGKKIKLTFSDFMVGRDNYCNAYHSKDDHLEIRDGKFAFSHTLKTLCGERLPSPVYSSGDYLWIQFESNSNNYNTRDTTGFKAKYEVVTQSSSTAPSDDSEDESTSGLIITITIVVCIVVFLVCLIVVTAKSKRTPDHVTVQARASTTRRDGESVALNPAGNTYQYPQETQRAVPSAPVGYSSMPQSSCPSPQMSHQQPPSGSCPMSPTGDTPQPSAPVEYPSSTFLNDPPPAYPDVVPEVPPPPYPGISPNPSHIPTTQSPATS